MGVTSTFPTTRRGYLSQDELEQYANLTVTDSAEADDNISQAEELIDSYVGFQEKFFPHNDLYYGTFETVTSSTQMTLDSRHQSNNGVDYFKGCEIEIVGGTGAGQRVKIAANTNAGVITTEAFTTTPDTTSFYKIYQLGKFPRKCDVISDTISGEARYYKSIPEAVKRAVAAQVQYAIEMGESYFQSDAIDKNSESIGDYSYSKGSSASSGLHSLLAPKAKLYLRGIVNRKGTILV